MQKDQAGEVNGRRPPQKTSSSSSLDSNGTTSPKNSIGQAESASVTHPNVGLMMRAPSSSQILSALSPSFFETPAELFDERSEALMSFSDNVDSSSLLSSLLDRVEEIDLARDAVANALGNEVRRSSDELLAGMRQVQDLDLDITRAILHVVAVRRRLASTKKTLFQSQLRIKRLSHQLENKKKVRELMEILIRLKCRKDECDAITQPLSSCISATLKTIEDISVEFDANFNVVKSTLSNLQTRITEYESRVLSNLRSVLIGPTLDEQLIRDVLLCFEILGKSAADSFSLFHREWMTLIQGYFTSSTQNRQDIKSVFDREEPADVGRGLFARVLESSKAFATAIAFLESDGVASNEQVQKAKKDALALIAKGADEYLKSPLVRSQVLDDFAVTIDQASQLASSLDSLFGETMLLNQAGGDSAAQITNRTQIESSIRLRARVYAQQYQAEGFQAMRGLLWRELWIDMAGGDEELFKAILARLDISGSPKLKSMESQRAHYVITSTMASGLPRQIQRTLDLMHRLPTSAAGEAFLGLLRIVDLYLLALLTEFVPNHAFFNSRRELRNPARVYMLAAKEALSEWLVSSSPRTVAPSAPSEDGNQALPTSPRDDDGIKLCELDFLYDESVSFETALVAANSLDFLKFLLSLVEKQLSDPLPSVERGKMASKMFQDVPMVIDKVQSLVHRSAAERLCLHAQMPDLQLVYTGDDDSEMVDGAAQMESFRDAIFHMQMSFTELQSNPRLSTKAKQQLWDESCACFFDRYLDAIANLRQCSAMDRGNMILHLASFWESLTSLPGSKSMLNASPSNKASKAKSKVDDFIKAFYYDKPSDLWEWMRRKKDDLEPRHYQSILDVGLVGQSAGPITYLTGGNNGTRVIGGRKDLKQEFDKVINSLY